MLESIIQALIIAGVTAIVTTLASAYVNAKILDVKINGMRDRLLKTEVEVQRIRDWKHDNEGNMAWVEEERELQLAARKESDRTRRPKL